MAHPATQGRRTRRSKVSAFLAITALALLAAPGRSGAELPAERPLPSEKLTAPFSAHWAWVGNPVMQRMALIDVDTSRLIGQVNSGFGPPALLFPRSRAEFYLPTTYYSRGTRGERTDVLEVHDMENLSPIAEVVIPPRRAANRVALAHQAITDDDRFVAVLNLTPAASLSIVDVEERRFAGEIPIPGCSLVYAGGARRFLTLCGNGALMTIEVDDRGREVSKERSAPFFDPQRDPVTEKAVRYRDRWIFVSFEGRVHAVDFSGDAPRFETPWSLFEAAPSGHRWRIGGTQHLAMHQRSGRLYSLVHEGGEDTHKDPGDEVWVYDFEKRERVQRIALRNSGLSYLGFPIELGAFLDWIFAGIAPALVGQIQVTQDAEPLLLTASPVGASVGVYDGQSGEYLRGIKGVGLAADLVQAPWGREGGP